MSPTPPTPSKAPSRGSSVDALALLAADHDDVRRLFAQYEALVARGADAVQRHELAERICWSLTVHATIEEEVFYPAARQALGAHALLDEAQVEHAGARELIAQVVGMQPGEALFDAKVKVLAAYVAHHVGQEEDRLFPKLAQSTLDRAALGEQLAVRRQQVLAEAVAEQDG